MLTWFVHKLFLCFYYGVMLVLISYVLLTFFFYEGVVSLFYIDIMWLKELLTLHEIGAKALWVVGVHGQSLVNIGVFPNRQEV